MIWLFVKNLSCWRRNLILVIFLSHSLLIPSPSLAAKINPPLVVSIESFSFPPILHASESGEFSGTMGETVKALCEAGNMICNFSIKPLKRAYVNIKEGRSDALITINAGQLNECCIPSDWSSLLRAGFFSTAGLSEIPKTPEELLGKSLIVVLGMKSPYLFAKEMDKMAEEKHLDLKRARNILTAVKMFLAHRAPLMWGGEYFKWYIEKIDAEANYQFKPVIKLPLVIWINKNRPEVIKRFNQAFLKLKSSDVFDNTFLLQPQLMKKRYLEAVLPK